MAVSARVVPDTVHLDTDNRRQFLSIIESALAGRPEATRRQLLLFLRLMKWMPVFRFGAPLDRLSAEKQDRVLRWFQESPLLAFRKGFWGLKAMIFMGYYGRPSAGEAIGYRPCREGNERLHDRQGV